MYNQLLCTAVVSFGLEYNINKIKNLTFYVYLCLIYVHIYVHKKNVYA